MFVLLLSRTSKIEKKKEYKKKKTKNTKKKLILKLILCLCLSVFETDSTKTYRTSIADSENILVKKLSTIFTDRKKKKENNTISRTTPL